MGPELLFWVSKMLFSLENRVLAGGFSVKVENAKFDVFLLLFLSVVVFFACFLYLRPPWPLKRGDPEQPNDHFEVLKFYVFFIFLVLRVGFAFGRQKGFPGVPLGTHGVPRRISGELP